MSCPHLFWENIGALRLFPLWTFSYLKAEILLKCIKTQLDTSSCSTLPVIYGETWSFVLWIIKWQTKQGNCCPLKQWVSQKVACMMGWPVLSCLPWGILHWDLQNFLSLLNMFFFPHLLLLPRCLIGWDRLLWLRMQAIYIYMHINTHTGKDNKYTIYEQQASLPALLCYENTPGEGRTSNTKCYIEGFGAGI